MKLRETLVVRRLLVVFEPDQHRIDVLTERASCFTVLFQSGTEERSQESSQVGRVPFLRTALAVEFFVRHAIRKFFVSAAFSIYRRTYLNL